MGPPFDHQGLRFGQRLLGGVEVPEAGEDSECRSKRPGQAGESRLPQIGQGLLKASSAEPGPTTMNPEEGLIGCRKAPKSLAFV